MILSVDTIKDIVCGAVEVVPEVDGKNLIRSLQDCGFLHV